MAVSRDDDVCGRRASSFSLSLAIDIYIVAIRIFGEFIAQVIAALFWVAALIFWYG